jgi:hypothetical protein
MHNVHPNFLYCIDSLILNILSYLQFIFIVLTILLIAIERGLFFTTLSQYRVSLSRARAATAKRGVD